MKLVKKIVPTMLSLAMCASLVAPALAASFNELNSAINTGTSINNDDGSCKIEASKDESGAVSVKLHEEVRWQDGNEGSIDVNGTTVTIDLNGHDIVANGSSSSSAIWVRDGGDFTLTDTSDGPDGKITEAGKSAVWVGKDSTFTMKDGEISGNNATNSSAAGGVTVVNGGNFTMEGGVIKDNTSQNQASNVWVNNSNSSGQEATQFNMTGGEILGGESEEISIRVTGAGAEFTMEKDAEVNGTIYVGVGATVDGENHDKNDAGAIFGFIDTNNGSVNVTVTPEDEDILLKTGYEPEVEIPEVTPPLADLPTVDDEVELEDEDIPLAGLLTRGDIIGYLWEQSGSPDAELSDFEDVSEDHEWAVAIGWAQANGIAVADLEGNFRPNDLILRSVEDIEPNPEGELEQLLNRYAVYAGVELDADELFVELEGDWDDIIMGEDAQVIFDDFFAKLELALAQAA